MTLAQLLALDPAAMWDALPRDRQLAIVTPLLLSEFAAVTAQDDGTDASPRTARPAKPPASTSWPTWRCPTSSPRTKRA